jgi:polar amino acid transport system substrate-binding protein
MTDRWHGHARWAAALLLAASVGVAFAFAPARAGNGTIRIGTEGAYPPFNYFEGNELTGFEIELARAMCEQMKANCSFSIVDWDNLIPDLLAGKIDAIVASMEITDERRQQIAFSGRYYRTPAVFMVRTDTDLTAVTPEALAGRKIGVPAGSVYEAYAADVFAKAEIRTYANLDEASLDLSAGRIDAVLGDKIALAEWLKRGKEASCCRFLADAPWQQDDLGEGYGIGVRPADTALARRFDAALAAIIADGTYDRIRSKYFAFDVR